MITDDEFRTLGSLSSGVDRVYLDAFISFVCSTGLDSAAGIVVETERKREIIEFDLAREFGSFRRECRGTSSRSLHAARPTRRLQRLHSCQIAADYEKRHFVLIPVTGTTFQPVDGSRFDLRSSVTGLFVRGRREKSGRARISCSIAIYRRSLAPIRERVSD